VIFALVSSLGLKPAAAGVSEIQKLAGCFEVTYRFAEDGTHDIFSERYGLPKPVKEWIGLEKTGEDSFLLTHVLFVPEPIAHWRDVWKSNAQSSPPSESWTQEVWGGPPGLGSELRYRCTAPWTANRWECHAGRSSKPIRDAGAPHQRDDYDWIDRHNILLVTPNGWVQNEHNRKMKASGEFVSYELGWITYKRIDEEQCKPASEQFPVALPQASSQP